MAIKLKSLFRDPRLVLLLKTSIFALTLAWAFKQGEGFFSGTILVLISFILYLQPLADPATILRTFFVFLALILIAVSLSPFLLPTSIWLITLSTLFYIFLGIKNLFFVYRNFWHYLISLALVYLTLLIFFIVDRSTGWLWKSVSVFIVVFLITKDVFSLIENSGHEERSPGVFPALIGFITIEFLWIISLLPFTFLNAANTVMLGFFTILELTREHLKHRLSANIVLTRITIFIVLIILIFSAVNWNF